MDGLLTIGCDVEQVPGDHGPKFASIIEQLERDRTPLLRAVKLLRRGRRVDLETAQTIAAGLLRWPPWLTEWERAFLQSVLHWQREATPRQLQKLRQITRNPMPIVVLWRRLKQLSQRSMPRRDKRRVCR